MMICDARLDLRTNISTPAYSKFPRKRDSHRVQETSEQRRNRGIRSHIGKVIFEYDRISRQYRD